MPESVVPFNRASTVGREIQLLVEAIERGQLAGDGPFTRRCHAQIAAMVGASGALLTHSGTAALEMAAILCDLGPGDEVIMPSFTFVSTANAVVLRGATPVFVDIAASSLNISPEAVADAVTPKTKAIFAVHYAGFPADMDPLCEIARAHDLLVVEDAAQALGSSYKGRPAGSLGDMAAFSFHETKNILAGEGGALTITRPDLIERAEIIREKGTNRSRMLRGQVDKYTWLDIGSSFLPGELTAAFLYGQLEQASEVTRRRLEIFARYRGAFADIAQSRRIELVREPEHASGNGHMFYLLLRDIDDRDAFIAAMREQGISCPFHYVPLHSSPAGVRFARTVGDMKTTDDIAARLVRLPLYYGLSDEKLETVISTARRWLLQ